MQCPESSLYPSLTPNPPQPKPDPNPNPNQVYKLEASRRARAEKAYREGKTHWMYTDKKLRAEAESNAKLLKGKARAHARKKEVKSTSKYQSVIYRVPPALHTSDVSFGTPRHPCVHQ